MPYIRSIRIIADKATLDKRLYSVSRTELTISLVTISTVLSIVIDIYFRQTSGRLSTRDKLRTVEDRLVLVTKGKGCVTRGKDHNKTISII